MALSLFDMPLFPRHTAFSGLLARAAGADRAIGMRSPAAALSRFGATDVAERDDGTFEFTVDAPGLAADDFDVSISPDNVLTISGSRTVSRAYDPRCGPDGSCPPGETDGEAGDADEADGTCCGPDGRCPPGCCETAGDAPAAKSVWTERSSASFTRTFRLPRPAVGDRVTAKVDNGVLRLTVPTENAPGPRRIAVADGTQ